ncbi:MAG: hypothetical protein JOZ58_19910 [Acetobacteraceae bacterium]|nr:hypothetical protein [Acetobacteraceae bacterium]
MPDLAAERAHLAKANRDIAEGEKRIIAQIHRLECLRHDGHETDQAELLLVNLQQTLAVWKTHRDLIVQEIKQLSR